MSRSETARHNRSGAEARLIGRTGVDHLLIFCPECRNFGLLFGTLRVDLCVDALLQFASAVDRLAYEVTDELHRGAHRYFVTLGGDSVALSLRAEEVLELQELLGYGLRHSSGVPSQFESESRVGGMAPLVRTVFGSRITLPWRTALPGCEAGSCS